MTKMMNPEKMGAIFQNINTVMEKKVEKGEVTKDSLKGEAEGMMNKMSDNPLFSGMMNKMKDEGDTNEETKSEEKELSQEERKKN